MRRWFLILVSILASCLLTVGAHADPSPSVRKLMDAPVSLFSFGLFQLQQRLDLVFSEHPPEFYAPLSGTMLYSPYVSYDWDTNIIEIGLIYLGPTRPEDWDFASECSEAFYQLRLLAGINATTGKPFMDASSFAGGFATIGYDLTSMKGVTADVDKLFALKLFGPGKKSCTSPLLGTGYSVVETAQ